MEKQSLWENDRGIYENGPQDVTILDGIQSAIFQVQGTETHSNWPNGKKDSLPKTHRNCIGTKSSGSCRTWKLMENEAAISPHLFLPHLPPCLPPSLRISLHPSVSIRSLRVSHLCVLPAPPLISSAGSQVPAFTSPVDTRTSTSFRVLAIAQHHPLPPL